MLQGFTTHRNGADLVIRQKKRIWLAVFLLFFSLFWLGISSFMLLITGSWFLVLFVLLGLLVLYVGLVQLINRTTVTVGPRRLVSRSGPIPFPGTVDVDIRQIDQLFAMESGQEKVNNRVTILYALKAKLKDGNTPILVQGIRSKEEALELERLLESQLGIKDRAIESADPPQLKRLKELVPALKDMKLPGPINEGKPGANSTIGPVDHSAVPKLIEGSAGTDIYAQRLGHAMHWNNENGVISSHEQFDWSDGRSDLAFEVVLASGGRRLYAEQTEYEYIYFEERQLTREELDRLEFVVEGKAVQRMVNGEDKYYARNEVDGLRFLNHDAPAHSLSQWIYFRTTGTDRFRLVREGQQWRAFIQEPLDKNELKIAIKVDQRMDGLSDS